MRQLNRALTLSRMGTVSLLVMCLAMACSDKGTDSNGGSDVTIEPDIPTARDIDETEEVDGPSDVETDAPVTPAPPSCEAYCAAFQGACADTPFAYASDADCLEYCETLAAIPPGQWSDTSGHTLGCRLAALTAETDGTDASGSCDAAGRFGGGVCGTLCDNYCALSAAQCGAEHLGGDRQACLTACGAWSEGSMDDTGVDNLYCRLNVLAGLTPEPPMGAFTQQARCEASDEAPSALCVTPPTCDSFCSVISEACTDDDAQFADQSTCELTCTDYISLPTGQNSDWTQNSLSCRYNHASQAARLGEPATWCDAAGVSGGGQCGSYCEVYCDLAGTSCTGESAIYPDSQSCLEACSVMDDTGGSADTNGDTVQCRINQLVLAGVDDQSRAIRCTEAGQFSPNDCRNTVPTCEAYCAAVIGSCGQGTHPLAQFNDKEACLTYCEADDSFTLGTVDDTADNTLGCRINQALSALNEPTTHCPSAGPSGGGVCGGWCEVLCELEARHCVDGLDVFDDQSSCSEACATWSNEGSAGNETGDTVQCRIEQLIAVTHGLISPESACAELSAGSESICVGEPPEPESPCSLYCGAVSAACTAEHTQYASNEDCITYCETEAQLPIGDPASQDNSILCRLAQANAALSEPAMHCPAAGPTGNDVCGSWCDNYCHLAEINCTEPALYDSKEACMAGCAAFSTNGQTGDETGDTVQCRLTALGLAGSQGGVFQGAYCPRAGEDGGGTCVD